MKTIVKIDPKTGKIIRANEGTPVYNQWLQAIHISSHLPQDKFQERLTGGAIFRVTALSVPVVSKWRFIIPPGLLDILGFDHSSAPIKVTHNYWLEQS